jgi:hypothetical protein
MSRNRTEYSPYFRELGDRFGLKDWRIDVSDEPPSNEDAIANIECVYGRKWAIIRLSDKWLADPEEEQRLYAIHELIHAHYSHADGVAEELLSKGERRAYIRALEYGVDGLANAIAPLLPLPSAILDASPAIISE